MMQPCMMPNIVAILCIMAIKNYYWDIINGHTSTVWVCDFADYLFVSTLFHPQTPPHVCVTYDTPHILCVCLFCGHWTCLLKHTPPTGSTCFNNYLEMFCNLYLVCTVYTHCFYELNLLLISLFLRKND